MKRPRFLAVTVGVLGLVLVTVGLVGLAQAEKPIKPRFSILSKDTEWVLDSTTALQWQKAPAGSELMVWSTAFTHCADLGGGSRLPEVKELISLVDYSVASPGPVLPAGHPFVDVQSAGYWSATARAGNPTFVWYVLFDSGFVAGDALKSNAARAWCVR